MWLNCLSEKADQDQYISLPIMMMDVMALVKIL